MTVPRDREKALALSEVLKAEKVIQLTTALKHQSKEMEECIKLLNDFSIGREVIIERLRGAVEKAEDLTK